jgi:predicted ATPase
VAQGKSLPPQVLAEVVAKTDGVPLFIEELTKMLLESGLLEEHGDHYALTGPLPPLAIPNTLQDSLMARLDRLAPVKSLAQLGAALGREFSYSLLHAVRHGMTTPSGKVSSSWSRPSSCTKKARRRSRPTVSSMPSCRNLRTSPY